MQSFIKSYLWITVVTFLSFISCGGNDIIEKLDEDTYTISRSKAYNEGITLEFPHAKAIIESSAVRYAMDQAWQEMLLLVKPYEYRQEVGFYIYYNHLTKAFWIGDMEVGPPVDYSTMEPARLCLGIAENNIEVCAFFHCHTPWYSVAQSNLYRPTGPSTADISFAFNNDLPGFVYDYPDPYIGYWSQYSELEPQYTHFGPEQRKPLNLQNNPYL